MFRCLLIIVLLMRFIHQSHPLTFNKPERRDLLKCANTSQKCGACDKVAVLFPCNDLSLIMGDINTMSCPVSKINKAEQTGGAIHLFLTCYSLHLHFKTIPSQTNDQRLLWLILHINHQFGSLLNNNYWSNPHKHIRQLRNVYESVGNTGVRDNTACFLILHIDIGGNISSEAGNQCDQGAGI